MIFMGIPPGRDFGQRAAKYQRSAVDVHQRDIAPLAITSVRRARGCAQPGGGTPSPIILTRCLVARNRSSEPAGGEVELVRLALTSATRSDTDFAGIDGFTDVDILITG